MGQDNAGANQMLAAGELLRAGDQGQMDADRAAFEGDRDFAMDQYMKYNAGILNNAPQAVGQVPPNLANPMMAALGVQWLALVSADSFMRQVLQHSSQLFRAYGNFMSPAQQQQYFSGPQMNFGGNPYI